jgi:hypothetical protein
MLNGVGPRSPRATRVWIAACVAALLVAACMTDQGGHLFTAVNRSDRDLVVRVESDLPTAVLVPAHSRGTISAAFSGPTAAWRLTVLDTACEVVGSVPVPGGGAVVIVAGDGSVSVTEDRSAFDRSSEKWLTSLDRSDCPLVRP